MSLIWASLLLLWWHSSVLLSNTTFLAQLCIIHAVNLLSRISPWLSALLQDVGLSTNKACVNQSSFAWYCNKELKSCLEQRKSLWFQYWKLAIEIKLTLDPNYYIPSYSWVDIGIDISINFQLKLQIIVYFSPPLRVCYLTFACAFMHEHLKFWFLKAYAWLVEAMVSRMLSLNTILTP